MLIDALLIFITGLAVGLISTLFGLGGGIIMVPILSFIFVYPHLEAVATSLATIVFVAGFNTWFFNRKKVIVWPVVPWVAVFAAIFAFISAEISVYLPERVLLIVFLLFLFWVAIRTFLIHSSAGKTIKEHQPLWVAPGIGTLSGIISGMTGIGGGGITTPLMLVSKLVTNIQAAPTSNAIMIFTALFGSLSYALANHSLAQFPMLGYIHLDAALLLFLGSAFSSRIGVHFNQHFPLVWRKTLLGIILLFICFRLIIRLIEPMG